MHILIGLITAIAGLVWALYSLQRAGVNLNSFNPFFWLRRREWEKKFGTKPIHNLDNAMEAAALLVVAGAKLEGEITRELKIEILNIFCQEFDIPEQSAQQCFASASYLLTDILDINSEVSNVLATSKHQFQERHKQSLITMLEKVTTAEGEANDEQEQLINNVKKELDTSQQW